MLQLGVISHLEFLSGKIDLLMLGLIGWIIQKRVNLLEIGIFAASALFAMLLISAEPILIVLLVYILIILVVYWSKYNIQQLPIVTMLIFSGLFTFIHLFIFGFYLRVSGVDMVAGEVFQQVILPSIIINIIIGIPMFLLTNELYHWVHPYAEEE